VGALLQFDRYRSPKKPPRETQRRFDLQGTILGADPETGEVVVEVLTDRPIYIKGRTLLYLRVKKG